METHDTGQAIHSQDYVTFRDGPNAVKAVAYGQHGDLVKVFVPATGKQLMVHESNILDVTCTHDYGLMDLADFCPICHEELATSVFNVEDGIHPACLGLSAPGNDDPGLCARCGSWENLGTATWDPIVSLVPRWQVLCVPCAKSIWATAGKDS